MKGKTIFSYFTKFEIILWCSSVLLTVGAYVLFDGENHIMPLACVLGATYLIFNAKGNPFGQLLLIVFSVLYGVISYSFSYYGEMVTYLGMSTPMAVLALISWLRNPYNGNRSEVQINTLRRPELLLMLVLTAAVTVLFYFILQYFNTANLLPSTLSVATSFIAVYLTLRRSRFFALAYAANDIVLIVLWSMASLSDITYLPVTVCFFMFLVNDLYAFLNWAKLYKKQLLSQTHHS